MDLVDRTVLRFESFELDVRSRELRTGSTRVRLQEQPFEILRMMVERAGDVVTRDELRRRLWPDGTFVDFEHSLNAAVKRLRAALGDDADCPRFVETIPRRGYRFIATIAATGSTESAGAASSDRVRLAVLPFTNVSGDAGQEYFSDGLTEEMIAQLGRLGRGRIAVIARWSSMAFKGSGRRAREIGEVLRAEYLLEGSVRSEGERVRITAWLVETASETQLWTDTYERHVTDCLSVQADVAARIARSLEMELVAEQPAAAGRAPRPNASAYQAYLKGRYHWNKPGDAGLEEAISYFSQAIEIDPAFAVASAGMARAQILRAEYYGGPPRRALEIARRAAERALELDPSLSDAHVAVGDVRRMFDWDWAGAESAYTQALVLNPSSEAAHHTYALLLAALSRSSEAWSEAQRALEVDPLCLVVGSSAAWVSYLSGDYEDAIEQCGHVIDMDPRYLQARRVLGAALLRAGRPREAVAQLEAAAAIAGDNSVVTAWLAHAKALTGDRAGAASLVATVVRPTATRHVPAYHLALAYVGLEDPDAAFGSLDEACRQCDPALANVAVDPRFNPLRGDDRFQRLLERLHLAPALARQE